MTFASLLRQQLVIERASGSSLDGYGQPIRTWGTLATVAGSVQPKSATEAALVNQEGAASTTHVIYLLPTDITAADRVRLASQTTGPYYQLTGTPRDAAGRGHHLECDAVEVA
jgi:SPP1 family predicted phage head-tail adaptor